MEKKTKTKTKSKARSSKKNMKVASKKTEGKKKEKSKNKIEAAVRRRKASAQSRNFAEEKFEKKTGEAYGKIERKNDIEDENGKSAESHFARWIAPSFVMTFGELTLYKLSAIGAALMVIWSLLNGDFVVAITFLLVITVVLIFITQKPHDVEYEINAEGIRINDSAFSFDAVESFEVNEIEDMLKIKLKNAILPVKEIYLNGQDPHYIRAVLEYFLPEEKQEFSILSRFKKDPLDQGDMSDEEYISYLEKIEKKIDKEIV